MKTLDEVIFAVENCDSAIDDCAHCAYYKEDCENLRPLRADALYYLKEYKANQEDPDGDHQQLKKCRALLQDFYRNDPLSWDELKQMEGKPVWVEEKDMPSTWIIIWDVTENWLYPTGCDAYRHEEYGKTWQAYREERA